MTSLKRWKPPLNKLLLMFRNATGNSIGSYQFSKIRRNPMILATHRKLFLRISRKTGKTRLVLKLKVSGDTERLAQTWCNETHQFDRCKAGSSVVSTTIVLATAWDHRLLPKLR
jgi:hypothetical protein